MENARPVFRSATTSRVVVGGVAAILALALTACAPAARPPAPPAPESEPAVAPAVAPAPPAPEAPPASALLAFQWARHSDEQRAIYLETFRAATSSVDTLARGRAAGTWAIITDGDETILDNSSYEVGRARQGLGFTEESWSDWV
ncbi:MAG TPA: hypothetical protein VJ957_09360, partial [Longimicrobiales bacterium]|nr:hypothetical protein [Longimicrobiales bacterium]